MTVTYSLCPFSPCAAMLALLAAPSSALHAGKPHAGGTARRGHRRSDAYARPNVARDRYRHPY